MQRRALGLWLVMRPGDTVLAAKVSMSVKIEAEEQANYTHLSELSRLEREKAREAPNNDCNHEQLCLSE